MFPITRGVMSRGKGPSGPFLFSRLRSPRRVMSKNRPVGRFRTAQVSGRSWLSVFLGVHAKEIGIDGTEWNWRM